MLERNYVKTAKNDIFKFEKELKRLLGINATIRREQGWILTQLVE